MSGGSLDYVCHKVGDAADTIETHAATPLHRAFAAHLRKVATALHDIEWLFSGDYGNGQEVEALRAVVNRSEEIDAATKRAEQALHELQDALSANVEVSR